MSFILIFLYSNNFYVLIFYFCLYNLINLNYLCIYMYFITFLIMKIIFFRVKEKINLIFFSIKFIFIKLIFIFILIFFISNKIIYIYVYFELISLLIYLLIYFSSFSSIRLKARIYLFIFISIGTFPILSIIFFINEKIFLLIFSLRFLIKIPILFFHLWLPKAHVEANYYDSIILARLLLKLGGYGILLVDLNIKFNFIFLWRILGIILISFLVLFLLDAKIIIAFSSIIHINIIVMIIFSNGLLIEKRFSILIISHAISSSIIFFMIGVIYEQSFRRRILINKNFILNFLPFFGTIFFVLLGNIGTPPFITFFSELYVYIYILNYSINYILFLILSIFFRCLFNLIILKNISIIIINKFFKIYNMKINCIFLSIEHLYYLLYFF